MDSGVHPPLNVYTPGVMGGDGRHVRVGEEPPKKRQRKSTKLVEKNAVMRSRRVGIVPTTDQVETPKNCMGIARHIYNDCVRQEKQGGIIGASAAECGQIGTLLKEKEQLFVNQAIWKDKCPCHTKQQAVEEFSSAKKTALKLVATGNLKRFDSRFKSRLKSRQETIPFDKYANRNSKINALYDGKPMQFNVKGALPR